MQLGAVTGGLLGLTGLFLLTAYCLRTRALERRVKVKLQNKENSAEPVLQALDTVAVVAEPGAAKPEKLFLEAVPGSNEFAESGANPIWQAAMESADYEEEELQFQDDASDCSGDSILIGVEDQTEFADYQETMKNIDVDMDLYARVQGGGGGRLRTLDDYQAEGAGEEAPGRRSGGVALGGTNPLYDDSEGEEYL